MDYDQTVTVNLKILGKDVAVELEPDEGDSAALWKVKKAINEDGRNVQLSKAEKDEAIKLAGLGVDETGR